MGVDGGLHGPIGQSPAKHAVDGAGDNNKRSPWLTLLTFQLCSKPRRRGAELDQRLSKAHVLQSRL